MLCPPSICHPRMSVHRCGNLASERERDPPTATQLCAEKRRIQANAEASGRERGIFTLNRPSSLLCWRLGSSVGQLNLPDQGKAQATQGRSGV